MEQIPAPIISTPSEEEEKILDSKDFELESDKKNNFKIKISKNISKMIIEGKNKNLVEPIIYYSKQSIEEIKKNKYFLMFDNLEEIYEEIINLIKNNKNSLIEEKNKLTISIPLSTTKIKEIKIVLYIKEKTDKEKIEDLYEIIDNLKCYYNGKINELINITQQQNDKINELINITQQQNDKINELKNKIEEQNGNKNNFGDIFQNIKKNENNQDNFNDSSIINKNNNYISLLNQWISQRIGQFKTKLLFRKSIDGDSFDAFHKLCDNQGKTLVLIKAEYELIIGGFTTKDWNIAGEWITDEKSFLFSLTKGKIFPIKNNIKHSIRGSKANGPWFAYIGFKSAGRKNLTQGYFYYKNNNDGSFENYSEIIPNDKKDTYFDVQEVEIYKIY